MSSAHEQMLSRLYRHAFWLYAMYQQGEIDRETYRERMIPLDRKISKLEVAIYPSSSAYRRSFLAYIPK